MRKPITIAVAILAGQTLLLAWVGRSERPPAVPNLRQIPLEAGQWRAYREDAIAEELQAELRADRLLKRGYWNTASRTEADLFVAWFQTQSGGQRQPHSPKVCLPGAGWVPEAIRTERIDTPAGVIEASRLTANKGDERALILYWYQTPRRAIGGEWEAKFWVVADAIRDRRTDTALVRIVIPARRGSDGAAAAAAAGFAAEIYPRLRENFRAAGAAPG
jgi:EpsI family protein